MADSRYASFESREEDWADDGPGHLPVLRIDGLTKSFPGTVALRNVSLDIRPGEIHGLVGHNGSGKSTLIKCLAGYHEPDPGATVVWNSTTTTFEALSRDRAAGGGAIRFMHQDLGLVNQLSAIDNFALHGGYSRTRLQSVDWRNECRVAERLLAPFDLAIDLRRPLSEATPVDRAVVALAIALRGWDPARGVLVLDEPTAVLSPTEAGELLEIVRALANRGAAVLYVSHRLQEVFAMADRVTVLRGGEKVATRAVAGMKNSDLVELMLGEGVQSEYRAAPRQAKTRPVLEVKDARGKYLRGVSITLHQGEVVGIAGLPDDGRNELPLMLGDRLPYKVFGQVRINSAGPDWRDLRSKHNEVALVPPDRGKDGVIEQMSVAENLTLSILDRLGSTWRINKKREKTRASDWIVQLDVKLADPNQSVTTLSGGNQQKVLIGRSLARAPEVLIMCEPTAGVDIGARHAIYDLIADRASAGLAVLVVSSDVEDLLGLCTRVVVLHRGVVIGELTGENITEKRLLRAMEGFQEDDV